MKIGPYTISLIETGHCSLDGGSMFGVVPKPLWSTKCSADENNRVVLTMNCLLVENGDRKILIDCGAGDKDTPKFREIFSLDPDMNQLEKSLAARDVSVEQITDVLFTHLHFDHCGGGTQMNGTGVIPTFPKARYYVQKRQYDQALQRNERDRASYLEKNYVPLHDTGVLEFLDGDLEFAPGIDILLSEGHTPALQTVKISDGDTTLWYPTDLVPMSPHVLLPYIPAFDLFPVTTLAEKKKFLPQAVDENWIVVFEHDPQHIAHRLRKDERGNVGLGEAVAI